MKRIRLTISLSETLHVRGFSEPDFQEDMIHGLVMDERRKETIKALAISFARRNKHGEELAQGMWSADFVRGKGSGLIFLLHGMPGVGKTCTAGMYRFIVPDFATQFLKLTEHFRMHLRLYTPAADGVDAE